MKDNQGNKIEPTEDITLTKLIEYGFAEERAKVAIEEVSKKAEKQWALEKKLKEMEEKVKLIDLECLPYKQTGTSTVKGTDEIQQILDDQLNLLIMMKASPAAKEKQIEKQIKMIEQKIVWIQDTLDYMIKV